MRKKRGIQFAVVLLLLTGTVLGLRWFLSRQRLRRNWKNQAVIEVARLASDRSWVTAQMAVIKKQIAASPDQMGTWVGDHLLVLGDGQWVICQNECSHQHQLLGDIFVGKASNGRWYYSSFHFCCELSATRMDEQPADLQTFIKSHCLREFDGTSDEAIQQTWFPGTSPVERHVSRSISPNATQP